MPQIRHTVARLLGRSKSADPVRAAAAAAAQDKFREIFEEMRTDYQDALKSRRADESDAAPEGLGALVRLRRQAIERGIVRELLADELDGRVALEVRKQEAVDRLVEGFAQSAESVDVVTPEGATTLTNVEATGSRPGLEAPSKEGDDGEQR